MNNYYYYYVISLLNHIIFWLQISLEHPIVINSFASLSNKNMPTPLINKLKDFSSQFDTLEDNVISLRDNIDPSISPYGQSEIKTLVVDHIDKFKNLSNDWISTIDKISDYGADDYTWQTLLKHIKEEQTYALSIVDSYDKI